MRYRAELPVVLKGLSLFVAAGEKIGCAEGERRLPRVLIPRSVVGRTGAGKSSIMHALFRLAEIEDGTITLDGIDLRTIGLAAARRAIAIIPQDSQLFEGTLRANLDPFGEVPDDTVLLEALRRARLADSTRVGEKSGSSRGFTLDSPIQHGGANLSIGERALCSLARALVKDAQVCVLDEATASVRRACRSAKTAAKALQVDYETDARIQQTIAREFGDKTVLTIAHRVVTTLASDRILVMVRTHSLAHDEGRCGYRTMVESPSSTRRSRSSTRAVASGCACLCVERRASSHTHRACARRAGLARPTSLLHKERIKRRRVWDRMHRESERHTII
jgi:ABC-type multidrug transport system fused ATPase/permease subunit